MLSRVALYPLIVLLVPAVLAGCASKKKAIEFTPEQEKIVIDFLLNRYDVNGDGEIGCVDLQIDRDRVFDGVDRDRSGDLDEGEYRLARFRDESFLFRELSDSDIDENGRLSRAEFRAVTNNSYARLDRNRDCRVDRQELLTVGRGEVLRIRDAERRKRQQNKREELERAQVPVELEELEEIIEEVEDEDPPT